MSDNNLRALILLEVIQRLNGNPYSLTKWECISEVEKMREAALAATPQQEAPSQEAPGVREALAEAKALMLRGETHAALGWLQKAEDALTAAAPTGAVVPTEQPATFTWGTFEEYAKFVGLDPGRLRDAYAEVWREARRRFSPRLNPQPDGGYPGCDVCTCPPGFCHQNNTGVRHA